MHLCVLVCVEDDLIKVDKFVKARSHNLWFETKLIKDGSQGNAKTVYCYISPKVSKTFLVKV